MEEIVLVTKTISSTEKYINNWITVTEDVIERPSGARGIYGVVEKMISPPFWQSKMGIFI